MREVRYTISRDFLPVLEHLRASLLISTYQAGKLVVVGQAGGQLVLSLHNFERAMGVAVGPRGRRIAVGEVMSGYWTVPRNWRHRSSRGAATMVVS